MSEIERAEQTIGLEPVRSQMSVETPKVLPPRPRMSRAWFDVIVLVLAAASIAAAWTSKFWPVGCADDEVKRRAVAAVAPLIADATTTSLHLISKVARDRNELRCMALARFEFADRPMQHRTVDYVVRTDRVGAIVDIRATARPADP